MIKKSNMLTTRHILFFLCAMLFISNGLWAQQRLGCTKTLQLARSVYQQGELYRMPSILKECLSKRGKTGFTKNEREEALKLLVLAYIYEEEPEKADAAMLDFLHTSPLFKINESVDPEEFIALYNTFRTAPLFSVGAKLGVGLLFPHIQKVTYTAISSKNKKKGSYSPLPGLQVGITFEVPMKDLKKRWAAVPELFYSSSSFLYKNSSVTENEQTSLPNANIEAQITQQRVLLNLMMRYKMGKSRLRPYLGLGPGISYLFSSSAQIETQFQQTNSIATGPPVNLTANFNTIGLDLVASFGLAFEIGAVTLISDIQYRYGLISPINEKMAINTSAALDYGFQINKLSQSNIIINFGFSIPIFMPKKKTFYTRRSNN